MAGRPPRSIMSAPAIMVTAGGCYKAPLGDFPTTDLIDVVRA